MPTLEELIGFDDDDDESEDEPTMIAHNINHMFGGLLFEKTAKEIVDKANAKVTSLRAKIAERTERVKRLREEYQIDDAALIQLLTQARNEAKRPGSEKMSYSYSNRLVGASGAASGAAPEQERVVGAGVVNNLLTETDFIEAEKEQIKRLLLIAANLRDIPDRTLHAMPAGTIAGVDSRPPMTFRLSYDELEYLGFTTA